MKKILIALVVVVLVVVVALVGVGVLAATNIDKFLKVGIEKGGTYATGVPTTVQTVEVSLTKRTFDMTGFELANPPGFDTPHFMALTDTAVQLDTGATDLKTITLTSLTLGGIDLFLDKGGDPSNYNTILNNLKRFESGEQGPPPAESEAIRVIIETLVIENIDVHLANMPGISMIAGEVAVNIPRIELKNVGKDEPMTMAEVIGLVVKTVLAASVQAGGGIIPGDVLGELTGGLGSLGSLSDMGIEAVGDLGRQIEEQLGGVMDQAGQAVDQAVDQAKKAGEDLQKQADDASRSVQDAADRVRGIFGGKKDDEPANPPSDQP
jgi:hypothetical protein